MPSSVFRRYRLLLAVGGFIAASFVLHEVMEGTISRSVPGPYHHVLHWLWGLLTSIAVVVLLATQSPGTLTLPLDRTIALHFTASAGAPERDVLEAQNRWLVQVRWIAGGIACGGVVLTKMVFDSLPSTPLAYLLLAAASIPAGNIVLWLWTRARSTEGLLRAQLAWDLAVLLLSIHLTGGAESPLVLLAILHPVLAGIILSWWDAYCLAFAVPVLLLGVELAELAGWLAHYPVALAPAARIPLALTAVLLGLAYVTTTIMRQLRRRESQLVQAGKMAAIGELAGAVAHEINNPLAIVSSKLETLQSNGSLASPAVARDLDKVRKHVQRIADITHGLLAYARPSHGRREPTDVNRVVHDTVELVRGRLQQAGVTVELSADRDLPHVLGNFGELAQVALNLMNNALDAMPRGGTLRIRTAASPPDVVLEVGDTGCGMTPEVRARLFEPFFTTKSESGGTGLGLAICMGLVRSHGGRIEVETERGVGSRFRVLLPALPQEALT